jgi:alkylation response protein AidB-like acyl-CoA dehydrogenase
MQPTYPTEIEQYREKIRAFLDEHLPSTWSGIGSLDQAQRERFSAEWRETLRDNKLLAPNWPAEYGGGGLSHLEQVVLNEEFAKRGVPTSGGNDGFSISMVGNTILAWGTEEQK